jgi:hypothetical protein
MDELEKLKSALSKVKPEDVHCSDDPVNEVLIDVSDININCSTGLEYSVDLSSMNSSILNYSSGQNAYGNITISNGGSSGSILTSNGASPIWTNNITTSITPSIDVKGDANFDGDIKWKGRSLGDMLETIENRLSMLVPDPKKLENFEALKKAYEHYKTLEALCQLPTKDDKQ